LLEQYSFDILIIFLKLIPVDIFVNDSCVEMITQIFQKLIKTKNQIVDFLILTKNMNKNITIHKIIIFLIIKKLIK